MIKAIAVLKDGRKLLLLGLDDRNVASLIDDHPIVIIHGAPMGLPLDIAIVHRPTLEELLEHFRDNGIPAPKLEELRELDPSQPLVLVNDEVKH